MNTGKLPLTGEWWENDFGYNSATHDYVHKKLIDIFNDNMTDFKTIKHKIFDKKKSFL